MDITFYIGALAALFVIIDPIGMALIFHSLIGEGQKRHIVALKACSISAVLLVLFGNYGEALLSQLGISIHAFKISGGVLLFYTAFRMVTSSLEFDRPEKGGDISVFPLSIPLLSGPGSLTVSILLFSRVDSSAGQLSVFFAIVTICLLSLALMLGSTNVKRVVGATGDEVLKRFLGMLLAALAIQFMLDGLRAII